MSVSDSAAGMDRARELMMRAMDEEILKIEMTELKSLVDSDTVLRAEWERLETVKRTTTVIALRKAPDEMWEDYMDSVYRRVERGIGWVLVSVGAVVLISTGIWQIITQLLGDVTVPWFVKAGTLALFVGAVVLTVSVIREKYFTYKDDPYRNVTR